MIIGNGGQFSELLITDCIGKRLFVLFLFLFLKTVLKKLFFASFYCSCLLTQLTFCYFCSVSYSLLNIFCTFSLKKVINVLKFY